VKYLFLLLLLMASGCASAVSAGHNTALSGTDLLAMTDDMAAKILASPAVQEAIAREGRLSVVVLPVENYLRGEVLPRGAAEAFTGRVRALLSRHAPDRFVWVMNRDAYRNLRVAETDFDLGPPPDSIQPRYALTARFSSLAEEDTRHRSASYLCVFQLTHLENRTVLWSDKYEVRRSAVKGMLD